MVGSDGVPGGFGGVVASGWGGPAEGSVGELLDVPPGLLLEPVIMTTLWAAITQARPATRLVRDIMFEVTLASWPAADRTDAGGVPDLGQVPQLDSGVAALGLEPVAAVLGAEGVELDDEVGSGAGGAQPPGPGSSRRPVPLFEGEAEPGPVPAPGFRAGLRLGPGAAVERGVPVLVDRGHAPARPRVPRRRGRQVPGQPRIDRAEPAQLPR